MQQHAPLLWTILMVLSGFFAYYRISGAKFFQDWINRTFGSKAPVYAVIFPRLLGVLFFGLIPYGIMQTAFPEQFDARYLQWHNGGRIAWWTLGLLALIVPVIWVTSKKPAHLEQYPQIRYPQWTTGILAASAFSWIGYLLAYEFLFRGLLLTVSLSDGLSLTSAITLNIVLYALVHWPKGKVEVLASIPFGLIIIWATLNTGNLWVAVLAHCGLALSDEWMSLYHHPEIHLNQEKK
ncbi:MAG: CPBP family intramembrane metalloprotease [Saprospiraceae bacterium]|nr:CPBP family intramembrane metalloprotease [Saprospiraceae bacterium]